MGVTQYQYLDETGVQALAKDLFGKVNVRIGERILTELAAATADDQHVLSAKTLLDIIGVDGKGTGTLVSQIDALDTKAKNLDKKIDDQTHLTIETVIGSIESVTDPSEKILYLQKDSDTDQTWILYIRRTLADGNKVWVNIGDTSVDLQGYWSKEDSAVEELRSKMIKQIDTATINAKVDAAFEATKVFTTAGA